MPAHTHHDPTTAGIDPTDDWLRISSDMTRAVAVLADRHDLVVTCAPGAGRGAPAMMIPALATIEVDGALLPPTIDPATVHPLTPADWPRYPALWGALVHECAHAAHTRWDPPPTQAHTPAAEAAALLEESRAEAAYLGRRRTGRRWLRAVIREVVMPDFLPTPDPSAPAPTVPGPSTPAAPDPTVPAPAGAGPSVPGAPAVSGPAVHAPMSPASAACAAALLLARADVGTIYAGEVRQVRDIVTGILGADVLAQFQRIWREAHQCADDDTATMMRLGQEWADLLAEQPDPAPSTSADPTSTPLAQAISAALGEIAANDDRLPYGATALAGVRTPTDEERAAARRLTARLRAASVPERVPVTVASATPPGRLRMRGALAADAQRAAGAVPTARPFTRTQRRRVPNPPLRLGIAVDVSGSMRPFARPAASAAWITATAAAHIPDTRTSTVIFGQKVRELTHPGKAPARVPEFESLDGWEETTAAIEHLTGLLRLDQPGATRMLVIISDGRFQTSERLRAEILLPRLAAAGCHLLWIAPDQDATPIPPARVLTLGETPHDTAQAIATAAVRALTP
ncbi:VWA domain-containing protein [Frankia sp. Cpl3]|nr:VWA domain-containing protein [Frankia sp. Cpl3]